MTEENDSGYMCSICCLPILESVLVFNEEKFEYYHKSCEK